MAGYSYCCLLSLLFCCNAQKEEQQWKQQKLKIAIIGGGITGSFVTKYLVDVEKDDCTLHSLTLFDPSWNNDVSTDEQATTISNNEGKRIQQQQQQQSYNSRIKSYKLQKCC